MRDIKTYLSTAPVITLLWFSSLAGLFIEINRFFPDALSFPFFHSDSILLNLYVKSLQLCSFLPYPKNKDKSKVYRT
nr:photosystem I subunit IX [Galeola lindleyana]